MSIGRESPPKVPVADSGDPAPPAIASIDRSPLDVLWNDFRAALSELTIFGKSADPSHLSIGRTALFYPAVGLVIGAGVSVLDWVLRNFLTQEITSVLLVGALALLSAGRQLDGFANTADGLIGFRGRDWAIATIRDRRLGSSGAAAIAFLLILKVRCLDLLSDPMRVVGVLLAPMVGRAAIVLLAYGARSAGSAYSDPVRFDATIGLRELGGAGGFAALAMLALGGALGLLALIACGLAILGLRFYLDRRLGGVTPQSLDAGAEMVETLALIIFALAS
jgi:adenosylcobinamide-GDP ribazoletransferase